MGRVKGIKNKNVELRPIVSNLSSQERIQLLANLIIDKALEDQKNGQELIKKLTLCNHE